MIDLLVAGGGPVGLATALYAHSAGLSVIVTEPRTGALDKACGEGLMPGAVSALSALGVHPRGRPLRGIRYRAGDKEATATFRGCPGLGVRRTVLQSALRTAVEGLNIQILAQPVSGIEQHKDHVVAAGVEARYLAAADGLHSPSRRLLGLDTLRQAGGRRFGIRRHFQVEPWSDLVEVHWSPRCEAYVTPVADDFVGVAVLTRRQAPFEAQLLDFPELLERLPRHAATKARAAGPLRQRSRARVRGRALLVGDAAGYVDALTGEGVAVGLASARALVASVVADDPSAYERGWRRSTCRYRMMTTALLWASERERLRPMIVPAAHALPGVFRAVVNQLAR